MKTEHIIASSIAFGLLFWIIDTFLDYLIFYEGRFEGVLILDVPPNEIYIRFSMLAFFIIFCFAMSRVIAKGERAKPRLRDSEEQYPQLVELSPAAIGG